MKTKFIFFILFIAFLGRSISQNAELDRLLFKAKSKELAPDQILDINKQILEIANPSKDVNYVLKAYRNIAEVYSILGYHDEAMGTIKNAYDLSNRLDSDSLRIEITEDYGDILFAKGDYKAALEKYTKLSEFYEETNNLPELAKTLLKIGDTRINLVEIDYSSKEKALKSYQKALEINEEIGVTAIVAKTNFKIGEYYIDEGQIEKSLDYFKVALDEYSNENNKEGLVNVNNRIGEVYYDLGNYKEALGYYLKALEINNSLGDPDELLESYKRLAELYVQIGYYQANDQNKLKENYDALFEAFKYSQKYSEINDSVYNAQVIKRFADAKLKKEETDKEIVEQQLNITEEEKKEAVEQKELFESYLFYLGVISVLVIFVAFVLYSRFKIKKRSNELLQLKNEEIQKINDSLAQKNKTIEEINTKIMDSIKYAEKIQESILPDSKRMKNSFSDCTIFFKPKDIVSGDFYWMYEVNGTKIVAAVDCTGHGVPGALMSMIGSSGLDTIIKQNKITDPGKILEELHKTVQDVLHQDEDSGAQDSMDIAICSYNSNVKKLLFAGAKRPLYVVKDGNLNVIKGSKATVGGRSGDDNKYKTISIDDFEGATVYLTSDGYADQNNSKRKKFGTRTLKALLSEIANKSSTEQEKILDNELVKFKGNEENRDDITIIGIKF